MSDTAVTDDERLRALGQAIHDKHREAIAQKNDRIRTLERKIERLEVEVRTAHYDAADRARKTIERLAKSVTLWQGKFHALRHENNKLRRRQAPRRKKGTPS